MAERRSPRVLVLGGAAAALILVTAATALAVKAPGLASSAQYKAFIEYVRKLDERSSQSATTETKNTYEAKLTAKETAAKHKANALFQRASGEVQAEANEEAKAQVVRVRTKEGEELEALKAVSVAKFERVESSYHVKFEHIVGGHHKREVALKAQVAELRKQKAAAAPGGPKEAIQERIEAKSGELAANRTDEQNKRKELKSATGKLKKQIKATAEEKEAQVGESADETVQKINTHWNAVYLEKKSELNRTLENRVGYLEQKLEQGRAAIAAIPSNG